MAMNLKWNGTTWAVADADQPDYISRSIEQAGDFRRSWNGTGRRFTQYDKWTIPLSWSWVGTNVRDYVSNMATLDGTVVLEYPTGTFTCRAEPQSYNEQEVSYGAYDIGITLKET